MLKKSAWTSLVVIVSLSCISESASGQQLLDAVTGLDSATNQPFQLTSNTDRITGGSAYGGFDQPFAKDQWWARNNPPNPGFSPGEGGVLDGGMRLHVGTDWLFFKRGAPADFVYLTDDNGTQVSHSDLEFDVDQTLQFRIGYMTEGGTGYEWTSYDFDEFLAERVDAGPNVTPTFFSGVPVEEEDSYTTTYDSRFKNYELNAWLRKSEKTRVGVGLRYMQLEEEFNIIVTDTANGFRSRTDNSLFGVQALLERRRPIASGVSLEAGVRGGVYYNYVTMDAVARNVETNQKGNSASGSVGFNGGINYRITNGLTFRAGYQGLFVGGLALAPDQSKSISIFTPTNDFETAGFYLGGGYVGATLLF